MDQILFLGLGGAEIIILLMATLLPLVLSVICLIDIVRSTFKDPLNKVIWAVIVLLAPVLGALAYLVVGRNQKVKTNDAL